MIIHKTDAKIAGINTAQYASPTVGGFANLPQTISSGFELAIAGKNLSWDNIMCTMSMNSATSATYNVRLTELCEPNTSYKQSTEFVRGRIVKRTGEFLRSVSVISTIVNNAEPQIEQFDLKNIDKMRMDILKADAGVPFAITTSTQAPYGLIIEPDGTNNKPDIVTGKQIGRASCRERV